MESDLKLWQPVMSATLYEDTDPPCIYIPVYIYTIYIYLYKYIRVIYICTYNIYISIQGGETDSQDALCLHVVFRKRAISCCKRAT